MEKPTLSPVTKQKSEGATIFKAMLERQKFISNHLENGGSIRELKQMGLHFAKINLRDEVPAGN